MTAIILIGIITIAGLLILSKLIDTMKKMQIEIDSASSTALGLYDKLNDMREEYHNLVNDAKNDCLTVSAIGINGLKDDLTRKIDALEDRYAQQMQARIEIEAEEAYDIDADVDMDDDVDIVRAKRLYDEVLMRN